VRKTFGIARYTFVEILRNKVWYVLVLFSSILILSTLLLGRLGGEQKARMMTDMGLAAIEMIALVSTVFSAVSLVLEEMESKTLYLILTRPVARFVFVLGRFLGLISVMTAAFAAMALAHALLLKAVGIPLSGHYAVSLLYSWEKIVVITSVALVFSLFSTSTVSAITFTLFFWVMGHFSSEILFLANKASRPAVILFCRLFYYLFPNFQVMNMIDTPPELLSPHWLWAAGGYGLAYTLTCLILTGFLFRKKEF
jgi:Cu-processing system permease protein